MVPPIPIKVFPKKPTKRFWIPNPKGSSLIGLSGARSTTKNDNVKILKSFDRAVANAVLTCLEDYVSLLAGEDLVLDLYTNGREHGYAIHNYEKVIIFSEYRNSDEIVLYKGLWKDWNGSHKLTPKIYKRKEFFKYDDVAGIVSAGMAHLFKGGKK